jgi:hypothetical protein
VENLTPLFETNGTIRESLESAYHTITAPKSLFKLDGDNQLPVRIAMSQTAYAQTLLLINYFDTEVAWHGDVSRYTQDGVDTFFISKIYTYPQGALAARIITDQKEYNDWLCENNYRASSMRLHGHSHVRMNTFFSGDDFSLYCEIFARVNHPMLKAMKRDDDFYLFLVFNKRGEWLGVICDNKTQTIYTTDDIALGVSPVYGLQPIDTFMCESIANVSKPPAVEYDPFERFMHSRHAIPPSPTDDDDDCDDELFDEWDDYEVPTWYAEQEEEGW